MIRAINIVWQNRFYMNFPDLCLQQMLKPISKFISWLAIALILIVFYSVITTEESISATWQVWATDSMKRIALDAPPEEINEIHLYAARGEYESFQIGIRANCDRLKVEKIEVSDLRDGDRLISQSNVTLYREHYVNVDKPSPTWRGTTVKPQGKGWYPDGLIPFVDPQTGKDLVDAEIDAIPFQLERDTNQPIWVDILVPRTAKAGDYRGTYTVSSDRGEITGKILLTVWDFKLPLKPSLKSAFLTWKQQDKNTYIELLKHKVMPVGHIDPADERELIDRWGLTSVRLPFWSGANYQNCSMKPAPSATEIREAGLQHQLDLMLYVYPTDEIDDCHDLLPSFKEWSQNIHRAGVKHLAVMSPVRELYDLVDIWTVNPTRYWKSRDTIAEVLRQGKEVWFYNFFAPGGNAPVWQIDFKPINYRIPPGFINQSLGFTGLLYWRVDLWTDDPWNNVDTASDPTESKHYPGEGMLIYPGKQVGLEGSVPSMRLKWIREGVEDYEYIEILKRWGYEDWAKQTVREVAQDMGNWSQDSAVLYAARQKLGRKIDRLAF